MPRAIRWRRQYTIRWLMIATAAAAVATACGSWYLGTTPRAQECRRRAMIHATLARHWTDYARQSDEGRTGITRRANGQNILEFHDAFPPQRPKSPDAAAEFDRRCEEVAAICRARADYHAQMAQKWLRGVRRPWESVAPDPPPPLPIEPNSTRDVTF